MPRPPNPATPMGQHILDVAGRLFYERGIRAVGVALVADEAGTTKKTLYDRFGSKDALVAAYLTARAERWHDFVLERRRATRRVGAEQVLTVFEAAEDWADGDARGCAFVNAWAELGASEHPAHEVIRDEKAWMRELFWGILVDAGHPDAQRGCDQLQLLYEGALVVSSAGGRPQAFRSATEGARALIS
jgi:AcrR family transcriptional regulator